MKVNITHLKEYGDHIGNGIIDETVQLFPSSLKDFKSYKLYWVNSVKNCLKITEGVVVIGKDVYNELKTNENYNSSIYYIVTDKSPRLIFATILTDKYSHLTNEHLERFENKWSSKIGSNVHIGENVTLGKNVTLKNNVIIHSNVTIGDNVVICENTVIGTSGLGFEKLPDGELFRFPQIGGVIIGNNVEIGTHCDIKRAALDNTIIGDGCKIGSYTNIGHNVVVGKNCLLTVKCTLCGSSVLGDDVTMGVQSTIKEGIKVPNGTTVGANSFLNKNYKETGKTFLGCPAKMSNNDGKLL